MMTKYYLISILLSFCFFSIELNAETKDKIFESHEHCIAYTTPEKIIFFSKHYVVGKNCNLEVKIVKIENLYRFEVSIPIIDFKSGIEGRDDSVRDIFKYDEYPKIEFVSKWYSYDDINNFLNIGKGEIKGLLYFSGKKLPILLSFSTKNFKNKLLIEGNFETDYNFFGISPPSFGILGEVLNFLEISFILQSTKIKNFDNYFK